MRSVWNDFDSGTRTLLLALVLALYMGVCFTLSALACSWWMGLDLSANPFDVVVGLVRGEIPSYVGTTALVFGITFLALALVGFIVFPGKSSRARGDDAARLATRSKRDIAPLMRSAVAAKAKRLGIEGSAIGLPVGKTIAYGVPVFSSFEDVTVNISGPRTGKTTCWVVPRILAAPGAVLATSNKRDIVDATLEARSAFGQVWVFDPQNLASTEQTWFWNPLTYVTDGVRAASLAGVFASASIGDVRGDKFFVEKAKTAVTCYLLAAAKSGRTLDDVYAWLSDSSSDEAVYLLRDAGEPIYAQSLRDLIDTTHVTKSGIYASATQMVSFVLNAPAMEWTRPGAGRREFDPALFVSTTQTLYCLSQEGPSSPTPLVTALTVAVIEAAQEHAKNQPAGRLALPMLVELDEAANVCRWDQLPDLYSHFGSRGICVDTILQSFPQGVQAWGEAGMKKMWNASNVNVYGGGSKDDDFLQDLSSLIGTHYSDSVQTSTSSSGTSTSRSKDGMSRPIATVSDLHSMPSGRAWVFASGARPVLIRLIPFWEANKKHSFSGKD